MTQMILVVCFGLPAASLLLGWLFGQARVLPAILFLLVWTVACEVLIGLCFIHLLESPAYVAGIALGMVMALMGPLISSTIGFLAGPVPGQPPAEILTEQYQKLDENQKRKLHRTVRIGSKIFSVALAGHLERRGNLFGAQVLRSAAKLI